MTQLTCTVCREIIYTAAPVCYEMSICPHCMDGVYITAGKMKTRMFDLDDACNHITLRSDGCISVESAFKKGFDGDYKLLISCVEDNANGIIDWPAVETDYRAQNR